jgi:hypothetical protein
LGTFRGPFWGAQIPQNSINTHFLPVFNHFSYQNGPIDFVRGPFSGLDTETYIPPTCGSVCSFLGPFGHAQCPKTAQKPYFLVAPDHFLLKNEPNDMVMGIFKLKHWDIHPAHLRASVYLLGFIWGCPNAPKQHKETIFWLFWTISPTRVA